MDFKRTGIILQAISNIMIQHNVSAESAINSYNNHTVAELEALYEEHHIHADAEDDIDNVDLGSLIDDEGYF
jgi:hypothetical protein